MKTLESLKEEYAILFCNYPSWEELLNDIPSHEIEKHTDEIAKLYAKEVAQEALKNASDNFLGESDFARDTRESILNESNIPSL